MTRMFLAAALAAIALPLPNAAAKPPVAATEKSQLDHIHTSLQGTKGPVVVLIPGLSTPGEVWADMAARLSPSHRVLVVEVKGFDGQRATANEKAGMIEGIVTNLAADLRARGYKRPVIVGHSFGGLVAMKFALSYPKFAKSIVVVDALPFFGTTFGPDTTVASIEPRAKQMRETLIAQADTIRAIGAKGVSSDPGGNMSINSSTRLRISNWSMKAEPLVVAQALWEDMQMDLRGTISNIKVPMTVLYQAHEDADAAAKRYGTDYAAKPDTKLVPVKDTGHFIQLDRPDAVRAAIEAASR